MARSITALVSIACLSMAVGGCGSESSSSTGSNGGAATTNAPTAGSASTSQPNSGRSGQKRRGQGRQESGSGQNQSGPEQPPDRSGGSSAGRSGHKPDNSLKTFGTEVGGGRKAEVSRAVLAFFRALATRNYARICAGITRSNREALHEYAQLKHEPEMSCSDTLSGLMPPPTRQVRRAGDSVITHVRIRKRETIVFFRPPDGSVSYIPMRREGGRWRSLTLVPGTPVNPEIKLR